VRGFAARNRGLMSPLATQYPQKRWHLAHTGLVVGPTGLGTALWDILNVHRTAIMNKVASSRSPS
jgi:hypothetical protein